MPNPIHPVPPAIVHPEVAHYATAALLVFVAALGMILGAVILELVESRRRKAQAQRHAAMLRQRIAERTQHRIS